MLKTIFYTVLGIVFFSPLRGDIISNGDFSDGTSLWRGDFYKSDKSSTPSDFFAHDSTATEGMKIVLNPSGWTKLYQTISPPYLCRFSITFKLSAGYKANTPAYPKLPDLEDLPSSPKIKGTINPGHWLLGSLKENKRYNDYGGLGPLITVPLPIIALVPLPTCTDPQTITGVLMSQDDHEPHTFVIALPPGVGSVTFIKIVATRMSQGEFKSGDMGSREDSGSDTWSYSAHVGLE